MPSLPSILYPLYLDGTINAADFLSALIANGFTIQSAEHAFAIRSLLLIPYNPSQQSTPTPSDTIH